MVFLGFVGRRMGGSRRRGFVDVSMLRSCVVADSEPVTAESRTLMAWGFTDTLMLIKLSRVVGCGSGGFCGVCYCVLPRSQP